MLYPLSKTHKPTRSLYVALAVCVVVGGLIIGGVPMPRMVSSGITYIAEPLWTMRDSFTGYMNERDTNTSSYDELRTERDALRNEIATLRRETYITNTLIEENRALKRVAGRNDGVSGFIPASIILDAERSPYGTYILDVGADAGIRDNMLVITPEDIALGYIVSVGEHYATASLFSAHGVRTGAVLIGTSTLHATLEGLGGSMQVRLPRDNVVPVGTSVVVPAFSGSLIGTVVQVNVTPEDAFQTVYVASPENIYALRYVLIDTTRTWSPPTEEVPRVEQDTEPTGS